MVCLFGGLVFFAPVALLVRTQAGVSESEFFLLQALLSCITALGEVPFGHITDKIGYKNSLILYQALLLIARALLLLHSCRAHFFFLLLKLLLKVRPFVLLPEQAAHIFTSCTEKKVILQKALVQVIFRLRALLSALCPMFSYTTVWGYKVCWLQP